MYTAHELKVKEFIEKIAVPTIHCMMEAGNPNRYVLYGGRCCKQISYLLSRFLKEVLPCYEWKAWESKFEEDFEEEYTHAWIFGLNKKEKKNHLILDYGKLENEYSFFLRADSNTYPVFVETEDGFGHFTDGEIKQHRKEITPLGYETYTNKPFDELYRDLSCILKAHPEYPMTEAIADMEAIK